MNINDFKQLNPFAYAVTRQSNTRHLSWMTQFDRRLQQEVIEAIGNAVAPLLAEAATQFSAAVRHEDECYLIITKSPHTVRIEEIDKDRDSKFVGLKAMLEALSRIGTAEQRQAALEMTDLIDHYKVDISERYDDETTKLDQLIQILLSAAWTARLALLSLTGTVNDLAALNQEMKHLITLRNNELATLSDCPPCCG